MIASLFYFNFLQVNNYEQFVVIQIFLGPQHFISSHEKRRGELAHWSGFNLDLCHIKKHPKCHCCWFGWRNWLMPILVCEMRVQIRWRLGLGLHWGRLSFTIYFIIILRKWCFDIICFIVNYEIKWNVIMMGTSQL